MRARLVAQADQPNPGLAEHLKRAEERADAFIGELLETTGRCGPIAETQLTLSAKFTELAEYLLAHADPDTKVGRAQILMARACAETARMNSDAVLRTQHTITMNKTPVIVDPLERYLAKRKEEPQAETSGDIPDDIQ